MTITAFMSPGPQFRFRQVQTVGTHDRETSVLAKYITYENNYQLHSYSLFDILLITHSPPLVFQPHSRPCSSAFATRSLKTRSASARPMAARRSARWRPSWVWRSSAAAAPVTPRKCLITRATCLPPQAGPRLLRAQTVLPTPRPIRRRALEQTLPRSDPRLALR